MSPFPILQDVPKARKRVAYHKRIGKDGSQQLRRALQSAFLLFNIAVAAQFLLFVRQFEKHAPEPAITRPAGIESWLPIAALMNLKYLLVTGEIPQIHPAAMFLLIAFLGMSILLRKSFCGWLCPIGTVSEWLWKFGRKQFGRNFQAPRWLDVPLRSLKYILMGLFVYLVLTMSAEAIEAFLNSPYGLVADVKLLNFFRRLSRGAALTLAVLFIGSVFIRNLWCRYLCPYGALMGIGSLLSPLWIRRDPSRCVDCAKCAKACPANLPLDVNRSIHSPECLGCMECVAVCPAEGALYMSFSGRRRVGPTAIAAGVVLIFVGASGFAKLSGHWQSPIPNAVYERLIPVAAELDHPR